MVTLNKFKEKHHYLYEYSDCLYIGLYVIDKHNDHFLVDDWSSIDEYELGYLDLSKELELSRINLIEDLGLNFKLDSDFKSKYAEYFI